MTRSLDRKHVVSTIILEGNITKNHSIPLIIDYLKNLFNHGFRGIFKPLYS